MKSLKFCSMFHGHRSLLWTGGISKRGWIRFWCWSLLVNLPKQWVLKYPERLSIFAFPWTLFLKSFLCFLTFCDFNTFSPAISDASLHFLLHSLHHVHENQFIWSNFCQMEFLGARWIISLGFFFALSWLCPRSHHKMILYALKVHKGAKFILCTAHL